MRSVMSQVRTNDTISLQDAVIRSMIRITAFKAIARSIRRRTAIISHVAEVPAPEALYGSRSHYLNPRNPPTDVELPFSRNLNGRRDGTLNPHHIKAIAHSAKLVNPHVSS